MVDTSEVLVKRLVDWGVDTIFGLPGDGINGLMEALRQHRKEIRFVLVRHEEAAALAACAFAKFTGRLGVCIATSGPGAIHLLNGLYDAKLDSAPVLALTGQTDSDLIGSRYQQEVDLLQLFAGVTVYNVQVTSPEHAEMALDNACRSALAERGVAHLSVPSDVQVKRLTGERSKDNVRGLTSHRAASSQVRPSEAAIQAAVQALAGCTKVAILAGSGARGARDELELLAGRLQSPVIKALLGKDVLPDDHPHCLGGIGMLGTRPSEKAMEGCDGLLLLGTNFPYASFLPKPGSVPAVQVDLDATRLGTRYPVDVGLVGDIKETLQALLPRLEQRTDGEWLQGLQDAMKEWWGLLQKRAGRTSTPMKPQAAAHALDGLLADDAIITCDSGTVTTWAARHLKIRGTQRFSLSGTLASMAAGLPYAIAAQVAYPERQVVAFVGDGGLLMLGSELATAAQHRLPIKVVVVKNGSLGMIKWEQMAFLGNPSFGVELPPVDLAKFAESMGVKGFSVSASDKVTEVLRQALAHEGPALVECVVDPDEPPMPPHIGPKQALHMAEALARGQAGGPRIVSTLVQDKMSDLFRRRP